VQCLLSSYIYRRIPTIFVTKFRANKISSHLSRSFKSKRPIFSLRKRRLLQPLRCRLSYHFLTSSTDHPLLHCVLFSTVQSDRCSFILVLILQNSLNSLFSVRFFFSFASSIRHSNFFNQSDNAM